MRQLKNGMKALTIKIDPRTTTWENIKIESDLPLKEARMLSLDKSSLFIRGKLKDEG